MNYSVFLTETDSSSSFLSVLFQNWGEDWIYHCLFPLLLAVLAYLVLSNKRHKGLAWAFLLVPVVLSLLPVPSMVCMVVSIAAAVLSYLLFADFTKKDSGTSSGMVESKQQWKAWLYLAPAIVLLLVFTVWPIINTVKMAFMEGYDSLAALGGNTFSYGMANFNTVNSSATFLRAMKNTLLLTVLTVPISTVLALLIAVALNSIKFLQKPLQTIFFLPYVTNSIAIGMVFSAMFNVINLDGTSVGVNSTVGIMNNILMFFGFDPVNWIGQGSSYAANVTVMVIYIVWNALPFKILVLLGGLQGISKQYYDAAKIDGTSRARILWRITVPLLSPMLTYVVITGFIGGFKEYSSVVGIFGDTMGPPAGLSGGTMNTMVGYIYNYMSGAQVKYGVASAGALILFALIFVVTMINLQVSKERTHY